MREGTYSIPIFPLLSAMVTYCLMHYYGLYHGLRDFSVSNTAQHPIDGADQVEHKGVGLRADV